MADEDKPEIPPGLEAALVAVQNMAKASALSIPTIDLSSFANIPQNPLNIFPDLQRHADELMRPMGELQRHVQQLFSQTQPDFQQLAEAAKSAMGTFSQIPPLSVEQQLMFADITKTEIRSNKLRIVGLLPHRSTPFDLLDEDSNGDHLTEKFRSYYESSWDEIAASILERAQAFDIDDEAKDVLAEALAAHRSGHYRAVCRLLLPEIERVVRVEFRNNMAGTLRVNEILDEPAGSLMVYDTSPSGIYALDLFKRLTRHLYVRVDEFNRARFEKDPVPNRHAAIHGLIVYKSHWHSLNVIFMTDYAFQIVAAVKAAQSQESIS